MMFHISIMALVERGVGDAHQIDFQAFFHDKICNWPRCIHPEVVQVEEHFYLCTYNLSIGPVEELYWQTFHTNVVKILFGFMYCMNSFA